MGNWIKENLNIKKQPTTNWLVCISASFAVGHAALSVHHPSHSQHWRFAEGQEVHRGLWDGGLRDRAPPRPAPPLLSSPEGSNCSQQHSPHPSTAVPSCRLSSLSWALGSLPLMDSKRSDWSARTEKEIFYYFLVVSSRPVFLNPCRKLTKCYNRNFWCDLVVGQ